MKAFNDIQQGDILTLEMRVTETTRTVLQQMFISAEDQKVALAEALDSAIRATNVSALMHNEAQRAIGAAVTSYFAPYGEGGKLIAAAVGAALSQTIPGLFNLPKPDGDSK